MVLYVTKWNIHPDKAAEYAHKASSWVERITKIPGLIEYRGYRVISGSHQVVVTYEFADMAALGAYLNSDEYKKVWLEAHAYCLDQTAEVWGPSPLISKPIRP